MMGKIYSAQEVVDNTHREGPEAVKVIKLEPGDSDLPLYKKLKSMNKYTEAKERVCKSLLIRINVYDEKFLAAKETDDLGLTKDYFLSQSSLLNRLERVITH